MSEAREVKKRIRAKIKELKPYLPRGTAKALAEQFKVSASLIYDVMEGRSWNIEIAEELVKLCKVNEERVRKLDEELDSILEQKKKANLK